MEYMFILHHAEDSHHHAHPCTPTPNMLNIHACPPDHVFATLHVLARADTS